MESVGEGDMKDKMMKAGGMKESDFKELPDDEMNHITVDADDYPGLSEDGVGDEVMFCVKGVIRSISQPPDYGSRPSAVGAGPRKKYKDEILVRIDLMDAALIHGKLPSFKVKKSRKMGMLGQALRGRMTDHGGM